MHNIYTTEGFILKSMPFGEANRYFLIFTKDFGLIRATAQGVRLLKSKLRYSLVDNSLVTLSVVRGKDLWRITSAQSRTSAHEAFKNRPKEFTLINRVFSLVLRLVHGEEKNERLFTDLHEAVSFLNQNTLSAIQLHNFECILALRLLFDLGYLSGVGDFENFVSSSEFNLDLISSLDDIKGKAIGEINKSLKASQL